MILIVLIPAVAISAKSLSQVLRVIGFAGLATVVLGVTVNDYRTGRLGYPAPAQALQIQMTTPRS